MTPVVRGISASGGIRVLPVLRVGGSLFLLSFAASWRWWVVRSSEVTV
jgi:hypothetical protein